MSRTDLEVLPAVDHLCLLAAREHPSRENCGQRPEAGHVCAVLCIKPGWARAVRGAVIRELGLEPASSREEPGRLV